MLMEEDWGAETDYSTTFDPHPREQLKSSPTEEEQVDTCSEGAAPIVSPTDGEQQANGVSSTSNSAAQLQLQELEQGSSKKRKRQPKVTEYLAAVPPLPLHPLKEIILVGTESMVDKTGNNTRENVLRPDERTEKPNIEGTMGEAIGTNLREEHGGTQIDDDRGVGTTDIGENECLDEMLEHKLPMPSSGRKDQACEPDRGGFCTVHECVGKFVSVSTKSGKIVVKDVGMDM